MNYEQASKYISQAVNLYIDGIYTYGDFLAVIKPLTSINNGSIYKLINDSLDIVDGFELTKESE